MEHNLGDSESDHLMSTGAANISRRSFLALVAKCTSSAIAPRIDELPTSVHLGSTRFDTSFTGDFYKGYSTEDNALLNELSSLSTGKRILLADDGRELEQVVVPICHVVLPSGNNLVGVLDPPEEGLDPVAIELLKTGYSAYGDITKVCLSDIDGVYPNCMCLASIWLDVGIVVS